MTKTITLLFASIFLYTACVHVEITQERTSINDVCDRFMKAFADGRYNDAFITLKANTVIEDSSIDNLQKTVQEQMKTVTEEYGKPINYIFVEDKSIKDFIGKRIYVLRFEKYYLTFNFILYKGSKDWKITKFGYEEGSGQLL